MTTYAVERVGIDASSVMRAVGRRRRSAIPATPSWPLRFSRDEVGAERPMGVDAGHEDGIGMAVRGLAGGPRRCGGAQGSSTAAAEPTRVPPASCVTTAREAAAAAPPRPGSVLPRRESWMMSRPLEVTNVSRPAPAVEAVVPAPPSTRSSPRCRGPCRCRPRRTACRCRRRRRGSRAAAAVEGVGGSRSRA